MNPDEMLSRIGGAVQGGSTKTTREREQLDRQHGEEPTPNPVGSEHQRSWPPQQHPAQKHPARERKDKE